MKLYVANIEVELIRKKIKNMHLYIMRPDGKVRITAPKTLAEKRIIEFISSRIDWIRDQQAKILSEPRSKPLTYSSGEEITVFGKRYILEITEGKKNDFTFFGEKATLVCKQGTPAEKREAIVEKALREALYAKITPLFAKWEAITQLKASSFQIKKMKTRWGTCNTRTKKIWLNLELAHKSDECIEYVIMHELAHLRAPNHGKEFIAIMNYYMPRWQELRALLNQK